MTQVSTGGTAERAPNADEIWVAIVGDAIEGPLIRQSLALLYLVPIEVLNNGLSRLGREESIGWMLNPTAFLDGRRFHNISDYRAVLEAAIKLHRTLHRTVENAIKRENERRAQSAAAAPSPETRNPEPGTP